MANSKYPNKNRNDKISELDFEILSFEQYENIVKYNYNVKQMRIIAKYYKLKVSGNKNELKHFFLIALNSRISPAGVDVPCALT